MRVENLLCHSFVPALLRDAKVAIDCGANNGEFAEWLSHNTPAQIYSFEPDPRLFSKLPALNRVEWIEMAVDGVSGEMMLGLGEQHCSSLVYREGSQQQLELVQKSSLDDFCESRGITDIDFIKLDVEGAELSVLESCSERLLKATTQLTVEFHDFLEPKDIPRIRGIIARLRHLGFYFTCFSHNTWGDCLFLNTSRVSLRQIDRWNLFVGKYAAGVRRIAKRLASNTR